MEDMEEKTGEMEAPEGGAAGSPEELTQVLDGIMASTDAMKTVAEAFMQMGKEAPAQKLMQASELAASALGELMGGGGKPAKGPQPVAQADAMTGGRPGAKMMG